MVENIFFSYSIEDEVFCTQIYKDLLHRLSLKSHPDIFYFAPRNNIYGGDWETALWIALERSSIVLVAVSRDSAGSPWVRREVQRAVDLRAHHPERLIIPLMLTPDMGRLGKLHPDLEHLHCAAFFQPHEYDETLKRLVRVLKHPEILREGKVDIWLTENSWVAALRRVVSAIADMILRG